MPSERFLNLPQEKRDKISLAAMNEFCREPLESVSINRIIREAGISRGSFYTYFEDKQDVLSFLGEELHKRNDETMKECLNRQGGDFFAAVDDFMERSLQFMREKDLFQLHKTVAINTNVNPFHILEKGGPGGKDPRSMEFAEWIFAHADYTKLNVRNAEEMLSLLVLSYINIMIAVLEICLKPAQEAEVRKFFEIRMRFLKEGAQKHE